ncbi:MAG: hypothetical protein QOH36_1860 [Actinomycetota bacterium]|nr:hypothetical protein [Actinomycetota bacterium]
MIELLGDLQNADVDDRKALRSRLVQFGPAVFSALVGIVEEPPPGEPLSRYVLVETADGILGGVVASHHEAFVEWAADRLDVEVVVSHLSRIDGPTVDDLLLKALRTGSSGRGHAAEALAERRDRRALPLLIDLLEDPDASFSAVKALHVLGDTSAVMPLARYADVACAAGHFGGEMIARDTIRSLSGQGPVAADLLWFVVPHASDDDLSALSWRNAAVVAAFDVGDAQEVLAQTWAQIETPQPKPAGTPKTLSGSELCRLGFPIRPGWPLQRGMAFPFSIDPHRDQ